MVTAGSSMGLKVCSDPLSVPGEPAHPRFVMHNPYMHLRARSNYWWDTVMDPWEEAAAAPEAFP